MDLCFDEDTFGVKDLRLTGAFGHHSASLVFNQYVNPIALDAIAWKYYLVYCVWLVFEFIFCYFYIVETSGNKSLEEIAAIFDGEGTVNVIRMRAKAKAAAQDEEATPHLGTAQGVADEKIKGANEEHRETV